MTTPILKRRAVRGRSEHGECLPPPARCRPGRRPPPRHRSTASSGRLARGRRPPSAAPCRCRWTGPSRAGRRSASRWLGIGDRPRPPHRHPVLQPRRTRRRRRPVRGGRRYVLLRDPPIPVRHRRHRSARHRGQHPHPVRRTGVHPRTDVLPPDPAGVRPARAPTTARSARAACGPPATRSGTPTPPASPATTRRCASR